MYDDQDRPSWLRDLRPARPGAEPEPEVYAPAEVEPTVEMEPAEEEAEPAEPAGGGLTRRQALLLAILLWGNVTVLGCLCLLATGTVVP